MSTGADLQSVEKTRVFVTLDISMSAIANIEISKQHLATIREQGVDEAWVLVEAAREVINEGIGDIWGTIDIEDDVTKIHHFDVDVKMI